MRTSKGMLVLLLLSAFLLAAAAPESAPSAHATHERRSPSGLVSRFADDGVFSIDGFGTVTLGRSTGPGTGREAWATGTDPDLEPGFPVRTYERGGTFHAGPSINVLVGNMDADGFLEMCATALAAGPIYCWQHTGEVMPGWGAARPAIGAGYSALGFLPVTRGQGLFVGYFGDLISAYDRRGNALPGWPIDSSNYVSTPPSVARAGGGASAALIGEEDWALHAYRPDASPPPGWPSAANVGGQERHTPAVANVDGAGSVEIFSASGWTSPGVYLFGIRSDGTSMGGYPILFQGEVDTFPAIGDVDGDGALEVVVVGTDPADPFRSLVLVISAATGVVEGARALSGSVPYGTAPALADLDQACPSGLVEIIVQTEGSLEVLRWNGSSFSSYPGWPRTWSPTQWMGNSAPVVGDVDGDGLPDVVFTGQVPGDGVNGTLYAYARTGLPVPGFPKVLPLGSGGTPALADVDRDGRTEIAVKGNPWNGIPGPKDTLWLYDLQGAGPYGPVHWGQFMNDGSHTGRYSRSYCRR